MRMIHDRWYLFGSGLLCLLGLLLWGQYQANQRQAVVAWALAQRPSEALLLVLDFDGDAVVNINSLTETALAASVADAGSVYLLQQEAAMNPHDGWLHAQFDWIEVGRRGSFVLFWLIPKPVATFGNTPLLIAPDP